MNGRMPHIKILTGREGARGVWSGVIEKWHFDGIVGLVHRVRPKGSFIHILRNQKKPDFRPHHRSSPLPPILPFLLPAPSKLTIFRWWLRNIWTSPWKWWGEGVEAWRGRDLEMIYFDFLILSLWTSPKLKISVHEAKTALITMSKS